MSLQQKKRYESYHNISASWGGISEMKFVYLMIHSKFDCLEKKTAIGWHSLHFLDIEAVKKIVENYFGNQLFMRADTV